MVSGAAARKAGARKSAKVDPRVWKKETKRFTIVEVKGGSAYITAFPAKKEVCVWTGKMVAPMPMPYLPQELAIA